MATPRETGARIEALFESAELTVNDEAVRLTLIDRYENANIEIQASQLPAFFVYRAGRASHEKTSGSGAFTTRLFVAWIVAAEIPDDSALAKQEADDTAEDLIDPVIDFLLMHRNLDLNDEGIVQGIEVRDDGVKEYQRAGKRYSAIPILIDVGSNRVIGRST